MTMNTPRPRSPPSPPLFNPTTCPPPPPQLLLSPLHDFSFDFYLSSSSPPPPPSTHHRNTIPLTAYAAADDMSRTPPLGRVGSDLSHNNYGKPNKSKNNKASSSSSTFFSGFGGSWRSSAGESRVVDTTAAGKTKAKRGLDDVGQWVKKYMASMVDHLLASFSGKHGEREQKQRRRKPHSFSARGPTAVREQRERWRRRRGQLSSAPASLRASPANSGHLSVGGSVKVSTSSEESTMEELQSAIEAAIAHCKNSISVPTD
uniref:BRI1 kinase inhibitor 1 n=1 Tax=Leersia perrieri TaxID=77586 RepID=A0A0D9XEI6_9ORYZ